jgi:Sulfatase
MRRSRIALIALLIPAALVAGWAVASSGSSDGASSAAIPKRPPVILLVFDEWPVDSILGPDGKVDAGRYPNIAAFAKTATWYANATTVYDSTTKAVPEILDGKLPKAGGAPNYEGHPRTIFDLVGRHGYRIVQQESATSVCPPRYCRGAKLSRPAILPLLQGDRRGAFERFARRIKGRNATLYLRHTLLPHGPYLYLPSGKQTRPNFRDPIPGMNGPTGFGDRFLTEHNEQRFRLQIGLVDRELGRLFDRLKREGTFDRSLIAFMPDHGIATEVGVKDRRTVTRSNIDEIAPIPMLIKAPGQTEGRIDRSWIRTIDAVPTIASILHFKMPYRAEGRPASAPATRHRRYVRMIKRDFSGTITVSASSMLRRRAALRTRELALYGHGDWASLYRGIGPHRELLGRPLAALSPAGRGTIRAQIVNASLMRNVNLHSRILATQVAGSITGGAPGAKRDVAVAVNGSVEAVGRTFRLRGDHVERFAAMVPETSLKPGHNRVQLFEVSSEGSRLRLLGQA